MKKLMLVSSLFLFPIAAQADVYIEGQVGISSIDEITVSGSNPEVGNFNLSMGFENATVHGLEVGLQNIESHNVVRLGLGWSKNHLKLDGASGNVTGGTVLAGGSFTSADLIDSGLDYGAFDTSYDVFSANVYYDFPTQMRFKPYLGIGVGFAEIEDYESGLILSLGGRYQINDKMSWGVKYQHSKYSIDDNAAGDEFGSLKSNTLSATFSVAF